jgi:nicotinamidase-related amidase
MTTALVLVDVQRNMLEGDDAVPVVSEVRSALLDLLQRARSSGAVVVHVQNDGAPGDPDEPGTDGWQLVFEATPDEVVVTKDDNDVFASDSGLTATLARARS